MRQSQQEINDCSSLHMSRILADRGDLIIARKFVKLFSIYLKFYVKDVCTSTSMNLAVRNAMGDK